MIICPKCKESLFKAEKTYKCAGNHTYDIAKTSHINLFLGSKNGDDIGDNKDMVRARTEFLNQDYYKKLALKLTTMIDGGAVLDAGCGEGYYTRHFSQNAKTVYATDISKHAVMHGAKVDKNALYFVSSVFNMPVKSESIDIVTSIFAPLALEEFNRVLKVDGTFLAVVAGEKHLLELKEKIYDKAYKNDEDKYTFDGFKVQEKEKLLYEVLISENKDIKHLFSMTPYAFKTSKEDMKKLDSLENLKVTLDFAIYKLKKV